MDPDLALILGLVLGILSLVGILSAFSEGRGPRVSAISVVITGGLLVYALNAKHSGYTMQELPDVFFNVIARFIP